MDPIEHLRSHLTKEYLERLSSMSLAAAGFSAGLLVLLVQTEALFPYTDIALWAAIAALMLALYGWQYLLPYILHGEETYSHISFGRIALLQASIVVALLAAVTALVWQLSSCAGIALVVFGIFLAVLVLRHNWSVARRCPKVDA